MKPSSDVLKIDCYVEANFCGLWPHEDKHDPSSVKSRAGFVIEIANCLVIWTSKLMNEITLSTKEAEYVSLSMAMKSLLPLQRAVREVAKGFNVTADHIVHFKTTVWEDNTGAQILASMEPGRQTPRSHHYAVKYHWFRSHLKPNAIEVHRISTDQQKADIMTKSLQANKFKAMRFLFSVW